MDRAWTYERYGDESVLEWRPLPDVRPGRGQVAVRVEAVSVNPVDWKIMAGEQALFTGRRLRGPRVFGSDFYGTVVALGSPGLERRFGLGPGVRVVGMVNPLAAGSARQLLCVDARLCVPVAGPADNPAMAGLPAAGLTAWRAVRPDRAERWLGRRVLLNGAAGGVGHLCAQMLVACGARVWASASPARHPALAALGVDACLDYRDQAAVRSAAPFDALVDCHGSLLGAASAGLIAEGGLWVPVSIPNELVARTIRRGIGLGLRGRRTRLVLAVPDRRILADAVALVESGKLRLWVGADYPCGELPAAVGASRSGHAAGKIVVRLT